MLRHFHLCDASSETQSLTALLSVVLSLRDKELKRSYSLEFPVGFGEHAPSVNIKLVFLLLFCAMLTRLGLGLDCKSVVMLSCVWVTFQPEFQPQMRQ